MSVPKDYGVFSDDADATTLVPGVLTAYRHFALLPDGRLGAMGHPERGDYPAGGNEFEAACTSYVWTTRHKDDERVPLLSCRCGFYASYEQDADFYDGWYWHSVAAPSGFANAFAIYPEQVGYTYGMVRAVVEMSGRIVKGGLGVRAQKMKIKAISIDWAKHALPYSSEWGSPSAGMRAAIRRETEEKYKPLARAAANLYSVELYDSVADMHADYPQPDLSALGIDPVGYRARKKAEAEEARRRLEEQAKKLSASLVALDEAIAKMSTAFTAPQAQVYSHLQDASITYTGNLTVTYDEVAKAVKDFLGDAETAPVADTPMQRAIEAKKNRPAPPGTGIDRRKRKL